MDLPADIPMYAHIKRELKNQIESGELEEGARVPSEFELARTYGVSRNPTRQALRDLELEGYIIRTPGRGSFVAPVSQRQKLFNLGSWRTLAVACPHLECHYTRSVIQGFIQRAAEKNFHTMVYFLRFSNETECEFLADVRNSGIEGMAIWLQHASDRTLELLHKFNRATFPFVLIDRYVRALETDFVVTNNEEMAFQLTRALIERGHRDIGFVTSEEDITSTEDRFAGYRRALSESEIDFVKDLMGVFAPEGEDPHAVVTRIMAQRQRPTAFFCVNDGIAAKLVDELAALGYSAPEEVELAAVDDNQFADALGIPMITAAQTGYEMGKVSADILLARVANPKLPHQQRFLSADLRLGLTGSRLEVSGGAGPDSEKGDVGADEKPTQTAVS